MLIGVMGISGGYARRILKHIKNIVEAAVLAPPRDCMDEKCCSALQLAPFKIKISRRPQEASCSAPYSQLGPNPWRN